ncbi:MAG: hypothetical protein JXA90_09005 [Planctomycetes bacterium]|nr:hypothetical protein [Planctomycetota bacterium]
MLGKLSDDLIASAKRRGRIPDSSFTDPEWLAIVNEEMVTYLVPLIMSVQEDYYVTDYEVALSGAGPYRVPSRAVANGLRELIFLDASGNPIDVPQVDGSQLDIAPWGFRLKSQGIDYVNRSNRSDAVTLRMTYAVSPSALLEAAGSAIVTAIAGTLVTLAGMPGTSIAPQSVLGAAPGAFVGVTSFDACKATPGFEPVGMDLAGTCDGVIVTLADAPPPALQVGDYVSAAHFSPVPQAPVELFPVLAQAGAAAALGELGKTDEAQLAEQKRDAMARMVLPLMRNRVKGAPKAVLPHRGIFAATARW